MILYYHNEGFYSAIGTGVHAFVNVTTSDRDSFQRWHDSFREHNMIARPGNVFKCPFETNESLMKVLTENFGLKEAARRARVMHVPDDVIEKYTSN